MLYPSLQGLVYSSLPTLPAFRSSQMPYPLLTVNSRPFNFPVTTQFQNPIPPNETVYEVSRTENTNRVLPA
jgi:hypothetical protein